MSRSRGAVLLARACKTQDEIAQKIGVSRVAVSKWINGGAKPGKEKRADLLAKFEIPKDAWDEAATSTKIPKATPSSVRPSASSSPTPVTEEPPSMVEELDKMAREYLADLREYDMDPLARARCMSAFAVTLRELDKWTGATFFKLPIWPRIVAALRAGLDGHPEAAAAIAREMRKVDEHFSW